MNLGLPRLDALRLFCFFYFSFLLLILLSLTPKPRYRLLLQALHGQAARRAQSISTTVYKYFSSSHSSFYSKKSGDTYIYYIFHIINESHENQQ